MTFAKSLSAALAVSLVVAAPAAAQTTVVRTVDARTQMQQYCAQTASRTDEAGRAYYAANCSPEMMARHSRPVLGAGARTVGVLFAMGVLAAAIFISN